MSQWWIFVSTGGGEEKGGIELPRLPNWTAVLFIYLQFFAYIFLRFDFLNSLDFHPSPYRHDSWHIVELSISLLNELSLSLAITCSNCNGKIAISHCALWKHHTNSRIATKFCFHMLCTASTWNLVWWICAHLIVLRHILSNAKQSHSLS